MMMIIIIVPKFRSLSLDGLFFFSVSFLVRVFVCLVQLGVWSMCVTKTPPTQYLKKEKDIK